MPSPQEIGRPVYVPDGPGDAGRLLEASVGTFGPAIREEVEAFLAAPADLLGFEQRVQGLIQKVGSQVVAGALASLHLDPAFVAGAVGRAREEADGRLRNRGVRRTPVRLLGGLRLFLDTPYLSLDLREWPGPRRGHGRRGPSGTGIYPVLEALGIRFQATPALASEVARQTVRGDSFDEARQALAERGIGLDGKTVWRLLHRVGRQALEEREKRLRAAAAGAILATSSPVGAS